MERVALPSDLKEDIKHWLLEELEKINELRKSVEMESNIVNWFEKVISEGDVSILVEKAGSKELLYNYLGDPELQNYQINSKLRACQESDRRIRSFLNLIREGTVPKEKLGDLFSFLLWRYLDEAVDVLSEEGVDLRGEATKYGEKKGLDTYSSLIEMSMQYRDLLPEMLRDKLDVLVNLREYVIN